MATGETKQIAGSLSLEDRFQTTIYDDILTISGASISLLDPAGEIFTDRGNDTVTVTDSTITDNSGSGAELMFSMGSDNDSLTISNSTLDVSTYTGSGNDEVTIAGTPQSRVISNKKLSVGAGNDIVTLNAILSGTGNLDFGADNDTLIFNGGTLALAGTVSNLENLTVNTVGGRLEQDLSLTGENVVITLNGSLTGTEAQKIIAADTNISLNTGNNIRQNVAFDIDNSTFIQCVGGTLKIYGTNIAFSLKNSTVALHDICVSGNNTGLLSATGTTQITNGEFSNNELGNDINGGELKGADVSYTGNFKGAILTNNANMELKSASFSQNKSNISSYSTSTDNTLIRRVYNYVTGAGGAILLNAGTASLSDVEFCNNYSTASKSIFAPYISRPNYPYFVTSYVSANVTAAGGAIYANNGDLTLSRAAISGNYATASSSASASVMSYASCTSWSCGGAIYQIGGILNLVDADVSDNLAEASASAYTVVGGLMAKATAMGGAVFLADAIFNVEDTVFTGNSAIASATASAHNNGEGYHFSDIAKGGAIYLNNSTMNYTVSVGNKIINVNNTAVDGGGFLYLQNANAVFNIKGELTIGAGGSDDSISGSGTIAKNDTGILTINSAISEYTGQWNINAGVVKLSNFARTINLSQWNMLQGSELHLTQYADSINMNSDCKIALIDLGGGHDTINTGGYHLAEGKLLVSTLTIAGGGKISSEIVTRMAGAGFDITFADVTIASNITGGSAEDKFFITQNTKFTGIIDLGNGTNTITASDSANTDFKNSVFTGSGNDTFTMQDVTFASTIDLGDGTNTITAVSAGFYGDITGGSGNDTIKMTADSSMAGIVALGGGRNYVHTSKNLDFSGSFKLDSEGETHLIVYNGASLSENALTVYANENAEMFTAYLDWSDIEGLDKVRILVSSDNTFETFEFTVELYNQTKAFTLNLEKGYFIQFQAQDEDGWSQRLLTDNIAPDQVTGLTIDGELVSWDITQDNLGGNGVKQYNIQVASDANFNSVIGTYTSTSNSYSFASYADGNYFIRIQAEDYTGNKGEWSNAENLLIDTKAPTKPASVTAASSADSITANWSASTDAGSGVKEYKVEFSTSSDFAEIAHSATVSCTTYTANGLADGKYYIRVAAVDNVDNQGAWSSVADTNVDTTAPEMVAGVKASLNAGVVSLTWNTTSDAGVGVKEYIVEYSASSSFSSIAGTQTASGTSCSISGLDDGTYYFRIKAIDKNGNIGTWSSTTSALIDGTAPTVPGNLSASTGTYSATLNWNAASDALSGVKEYEYIISTDSNFSSTAFTGKTSALNKAISEIGYGTYYYKVRAIDNYGNVGNWSDAEIFSIADASKPELTLSGNPANWTNQPVTVSANATDTESGIRMIEYSTDNRTWQTGATVTVNSNGTVYFRATDNDGNVTTKSVSVTKIDTTAPVFEISKNTEALTNQNVILSVSAEDSASGIKSIQYSFDNRSWLTGSTVSVDSNKTVYFKVTDNAGNITEKSVAVNNIDKVAPNKPTADADITSVTNGNVTVSATFSNDTVSREYSLDNKTWKTYTSGVTMSANGKVYFRGKDEAGNVSAITTYEVTNIDKVAPDKPTADADITTATNGNVTVSAIFSSDTVSKEFSLDNKSWQTYTAAIVFEQNGVVYFRGTDEAGNISEVTTYEVSNIDKVAPNKPTAKADITMVTNGDVTVSATFSSDSVVKEYSLDNKNWKSYTSGIKFDQNGIVYFRSTDEAGNISEITTYQVTNIDKVAPNRPTANADTTTATNGDVTVSATFSSDSVVKEYSLDNKNWKSYTSDIKFDQNGIVYFRGTDEAGNISEVTTYQVTNIDKVAPNKPTANADITTATNGDVTVSATFSSDSVVKEYSLDNKNWQTYTAGVIMETNGTVYFRSKDDAGNISEVTEFAVRNIDNVAPTFDVTRSTESLTNQNVILSVVAQDGASGIKSIQYSLDNSTWISGSTVNVDSNKTVYFKVTDNAGNVTEQSVVVSNIDKVAPEKPTASADITSVTNGNVTVSATFSNDTVSREYSLDNKTWKTYTAGVMMSANGKVYFRGADAAGNISAITEYAVNNIDKTAPDKPEVYSSITAPTNKNVTVSAEFSLDSVQQQYSLDNQTWNTYEDGIVFNRNGIVYFRGIDAAGNISDVTEYRVGNIDKIAPAAPTASANINTLTNGSVIVTAEFSSDTVRKEFSYDGQTWGAYNSGIEITANGTLYFRGKDAAGNYSEITEYEVTNIDKIAPAKPTVSANITTATNQNVTVSATFSNDTVTKEYSLDNKFWQAYTAGVIMDANGIVYFRAKDAAGNYSEITEYEVRNIDKTAPNKPVASADVTLLTNQNVTVSATFSDDSVVKEYSLDNKNWQTYSTGIVMTDNGKVYFRGTDSVGNVSAVTEYQVSNIDKIAPVKPIANLSTQSPAKLVTVTAVFSQDSKLKQYKIGDGDWINYTSAFNISDNVTVYFRAEDAAGNESTSELVITNIDTIAPNKPVAISNITSATKDNVTVSATFSSDTVIKEYSLDNKNWEIYTSSIVFEQNGVVYFRGTDEAGNVSEVTEYKVANIDKVAPVKPVATSNNTNPTNSDVTVEVAFSHDSVVKQYRIGNGEWQNYIEAFTVSENGTIYFRAEDAAGNESTNELVITNIDKVAPRIPVGFNETISGYNAKLDWSEAADIGVSGVKGYYVRYGTSELLTGEGKFITASEFDLTDLAVGTYYYQVKTLDNVNNISEWSEIQSFEVKTTQVENLRGDSSCLSWDAIPGVEGYIVEYSTDNFANVMSFETTSNKVDSIALPVGTYQWRVNAINGENFSTGKNIISQHIVAEPQEFVSNADGNTDVFFANANGNWAAGYAAQHAGILNGWDGTNESVTLYGKNKLADIFEGSSDANILVMTDDTHGDALFVDDIYTALPGTINEQQARIAQIDEIRAGLGDDIVDMTSQRFTYIGDGVKIYGGDGNDTLWANNGNNTLFGDAGNDRLVGGANNDVIGGGSGNDRMHGGGGDDIFCFGENWGKDTVEQLAGGEITLWFESGSADNWNADTLTYTDGKNSVKVSGVSADNITLIFGDDSSSLYDELTASGCFDDAASEKIFEDKNKAMLA